MPKRRTPAPSTDELASTTPESRYRIARYQRTRYWGLYDGQELLAVTVYRKGARALLQRLQTNDQAIEALQGQRIADAPASLWRPPQQLDLLAAEDLTPYRIITPRRRPSLAPLVVRG